MGSDPAVGRAVASDTRSPWFETSHRQTLFYLFTVNCIEKTKIKEKEAGICSSFKFGSDQGNNLAHKGPKMAPRLILKLTHEVNICSTNYKM